MSPLFKLFLIILAIGVGGILIASKAEAQEPEYTMDDFKQCSLLIKGRKQAADLVNVEVDIMNQATTDMSQLGDLYQKGNINDDELGELLPALVATHNKSAGIAARRGAMYNKLTLEYNKACFHTWPLIIVDAACVGESQELTIDFCEELKQ